MDLKLKGKRALVTGSTSGLGESIVKMLQQKGLRLSYMAEILSAPNA